MQTVDEAIAAGKEFLAIRCSTCRVLHHTPWRRLPGLLGSDRLAELPSRLRCRRCGTRPDPENVKPGSQSDAHGVYR